MAHFKAFFSLNRQKKLKPHGKPHTNSLDTANVSRLEGAQRLSFCVGAVIQQLLQW